MGPFTRSTKGASAGARPYTGDLPPPYQSQKSTSKLAPAPAFKENEEIMILVRPEETEYRTSCRLLCARSGFIRLAYFRGAISDNQIPIKLPTTGPAIF